MTKVATRHRQMFDRKAHAISLLSRPGVNNLATVPPRATFDKNLCGRAHVIQNISYGGRALIKFFVYCIRVLSRKTNKQACGSRTEAMQKNKNILNSLAAVIHENKRDATGNSEKVVHPGPVDSRSVIGNCSSISDWSNVFHALGACNTKRTSFHAIQTYFMHWVVCATNQSELSLTERQVLVKIVLRFTFFNEDWLLLKSVACLVTVKRRRYRFLMSALETRSHTNVPQARIFCCFVETSVVQMMLFCLCSHFFSGAARYLRF